MGQNQTMVSQLESIQGGLFNHKRLTLIKPKQFEFQGEWLQATPPNSKLVRWGVTQAKASSQNRKGGLHKDLHKIYTSIYTKSYKTTKGAQSTSGTHPNTKEAH